MEQVQSTLEKEKLPVEQSPEKLKLVYILGAGHCGSTLLNLLLNAHSDIMALSELSKMKKHMTVYAGQEDGLFHEPFWRRVRDRFEQVSPLPMVDLDTRPPTWSLRGLAGLTPEQIREWNAANERILTCIAEEGNVPILADASKLWQRLYLLRRSGTLDIYVLHIVRDGRAVVNSYLKKYGTFRHGLRKWMRSSLYAFYLKGKFDKRKWMRIHYEDLARDPEASLKEICGFVGVDFQDDMLRFREAVNVGIGGNRMRKNTSNEIVLDERWKRELSWQHRTLFGILGGWLNKLYGY